MVGEEGSLATQHRIVAPVRIMIIMGGEKSSQ